MIGSKKFYNWLDQQGISFFTGIPDSLLKDFCAFLSVNVPSEKHVIAANEGGAVGLATGHYLATGKPALVYMQNAGQGNAVNPLLSLADPEVYGIPMILLIGWRGEPGVQDEPQHIKQGKVTLPLLDAMGIAWKIIPENELDARKVISEIITYAIKHSCPVALIAKKDTFEKYAVSTKKSSFLLSREDAIREIVSSLPHHAAVISSTGHISRELFELRKDDHRKDFLTVGSMGHASQIAMGIAMRHPKRTVVCLDGDGAALMHLGSLAIIGQSSLKNFKHIILNNGAHGSVGGQPTVGFKIDFPKIAKACGYTFVKSVHTRREVKKIMPVLLKTKGKNLLEIKVSLEVRNDLGRPTSTPVENKDMLMSFLNGKNE
ncbi:MAG: phosphonopyruvate decarboxylase [Candidatus Pacebacteria bacterium]|nr:phosphonopyruvate decarboxylase [Candidatus Paceibacterota bacterium]MDD5356542.1 phosphonopyruvate decarboxylase [Candidatus Paceibacterota bacterium]